jgi:deoxyribodipyrimidine photo-lyase
MDGSATPQSFEPTRNAALDRLRVFAPKAGGDYARLRNYDLGPGRHVHVSTLSPYLRHRLLTEDEVLRTVLARHSPQAAEKFIQEVFWRSYWKGWLEMRPAVWTAYREGLAAALNRTQVESGLRQRWSDACNGQTGIDGFDHWAHELIQTGYLHNHARMWFASIWVFTLGLPWELGADFFLRHLHDGDPASNTLGWRWVAGLQTRGKTYLARPDNIARYTERRFHPAGLAPAALPLDGPDHPQRRPAPVSPHWTASRRSGVLLHEDDLSPAYLFETGLAPVSQIRLQTTSARSPLAVSPQVTAFVSAALEDAATRWRDRSGEDAGHHDQVDAIADWARASRLEQIVTPYAPVGPTAEALDKLDAALAPHGIALIRPLRPYDERAWPHATHGFFRFKDQIPSLLSAMGL